jgi:hypothetical protein
LLSITPFIIIYQYTRGWGTSSVTGVEFAREHWIEVYPFPGEGKPQLATGDIGCLRCRGGFGRGSPDHGTRKRRQQGHDYTNNRASGFVCGQSFTD